MLTFTILISILKPYHQSMNLINTTSHLNIIHWSMSHYSFITDNEQAPSKKNKHKTETNSYDLSYFFSGKY